MTLSPALIWIAAGNIWLSVAPGGVPAGGLPCSPRSTCRLAAPAVATPRHAAAASAASDAVRNLPMHALLIAFEDPWTSVTEGTSVYQGGGRAAGTSRHGFAYGQALGRRRRRSTALSRRAPDALPRACGRRWPRRRARGVPPARLDPVRPAVGRRPQPRPGAPRAGRRLRPRLVRASLRAARAVRGVQQGSFARPHERLPVVPGNLELEPEACPRRARGRRRAGARASACRGPAVVARLRAPARVARRLVRRPHERRARSA